MSDEIKKELERIKMESTILQKGDERYSFKWVEKYSVRGLVGLLSIFGVAVALQLLKASGWFPS